MRMIFAALPLALGLAACQTYPKDRYEPAGFPQPAVPMGQPVDPAAPVMTVDVRGNPRVLAPLAGPVTTVERTRWRVTRINGRAVPRRGDYHLDFDSGRIVARFGCNAISGPYSQTGTTLDAGALISTRMACGNMNVETQALAILDQLMTIRVVGRNRLTLSSSAGTIDLARR